jgi:hypothetical protein
MTNARDAKPGGPLTNVIVRPDDRLKPTVNSGNNAASSQRGSHPRRGPIKK